MAKRIKLDDRKRIVHAGIIRLFNRRENGGYDFTQVRLTANAYEITRESAEQSNEHYSDQDYRQRVGEIANAVSFYSATFDVDFMHASRTNDDGSTCYCEPKFELRRSADLAILKVIFDSCRASELLTGDATPDCLIADFLARGYVMVKQDSRDITRADGSTYFATLEVRDHAAEAAVKARVTVIKAAMAERTRVYEAESAQRAAEYKREREAREAAEANEQGNAPTLAD